MNSRTGEGDKLLSSDSAHPNHCFSLAEIQSATKDFDDENVIGHGGFGKVYKGQIFIGETNHVVAIKRLDSMSNQGAHEFRAELEMFSKLRHYHLVSLLGFCDDNKERILVYEYMPHGTLYHHLHKAKTPLNWIQRLKIAICAGYGLDYLHTQHGVIHRNVKSSNIFVDENWAAMISDFGLSKIGPTNQSSVYVDASGKDTWGYLDPEYFYTGKLTRKTDMYAFGIVLFELLSGRLPVNIGYDEEQCSLVRWTQQCEREGKLDQMVDSNIKGTIAPDCLKWFVEIADLCLLNVLEKQITMTQVVAKLQDLLVLQKKYDESDKASSGMMEFLWNFHKYPVPKTTQNSDQSDTNSPKSIESNMNQFSSTNKDGSDQGRMQHQHRKLAAGDVRMFTYGELERATKNFSDDTCMGVRSYVKIYKAPVDRRTYVPTKCMNGLLLVIKRLHPYTFFDLNMLKEFCHPNLVKPIGYCMEGEQLFLTYGFMFGGNFEGRLQSGFIARFALDKKVKIAVGIARGIVYLHEMQLYGTQHEAEVNPFVRTGPVSEYLLDRRKILLDEVQYLPGADPGNLVIGVTFLE